MHQLERIATKLLRCLPLFALLLFAHSANAATLVLNAIDDFPNRNAGEAPYFAEAARGALAINAADPTLRNIFAKAETTFSGVSGSYDVSLIGLAELDGEALYRFSVNGEVMGSAQNSPTSVDFMPMSHQFEGIELAAGDVLAVESLANSNELIPENGEYAFARGRWTELRLTPAGEVDEQPNKVSLITNASTLSSAVSVGEEIAIDYAVINDDAAGATATNLRVQFNVPENFRPSESNPCIQVTPLPEGPHIQRCSLSQISPGSTTSGQFYVVALTEGADLEIHATAIANETEISGIDNRATILLDIVETTTQTPIDQSTTTDTTTPIEETVEETEAEVDGAEDTAAEEGDETSSQSTDGTESSVDGVINSEDSTDEMPSLLETSQSEFDTGTTASETSDPSNNTIFQPLPESEAVQSPTALEATGEPTITTGGAFGSGTAIALLVFSFMAVRRARQ